MSDLVLKPTAQVVTVCAEGEGKPLRIEIIDVDKEKESEDRSIYDSAFAAGVEEGIAQGLEKAREENATLIKHLKRIFDELVTQRDSLFQEAETFIIKLVTAIAKKVIRHELESNPGYVETLVQETLGYVLDNDSVVVRVHPNDLELIKNVPEGSALSVRDFKRLEFKGDSSIERGGCIVETNSGTIDARLEVQLEEIESDLLEKALDK